jgi:hypothetical protein
LTLSVTSACNQVGPTDTTGGAGFTDIENAAIAAAQNAGINLDAYDTVFLIGPYLASCSLYGAAAATIGGTPGFVEYISRGSILSDHVVAHEIGHNLGLHHARFLNCDSAVYENNALSLCGYVEYGDFDVMGQTSNSSFHFNSVFKEFLGWLQPQPVTATGVYKLTPYELGPGTKALEIAPLQASDTFYFEYRQPLGYDVDEPVVFNGPFFHLGGNPSYLLNITPSEMNGVGDFAEPLYPGLSPGQTYVDYANRFSVTTLSTTPAAAQLLILVPGPDSPTLAFDSPSDGGTVWGTTSISIDALDLSAISKVDIALDGAPLTTLTTAPYTFAWNSSNASLGQHVLSATAYNTQGNTATKQITVTVAPQQIGAMTSGASFVPVVSPGSIVSLFISGFSLPTASATTVPLPNNLGGASVTIGGQSLPFFYVSSTSSTYSFHGTFRPGPTASPWVAGACRRPRYSALYAPRRASSRTGATSQ